jgi:hypothetical protein
VATGIGYAGLTPLQRGHFLQWVAEPGAPAPPAFQQLYLAHLEVGLLEGGTKMAELLRELRRLGRMPTWQQQGGLARTTLLAYWLAQDGAGLAEWSGELLLPPALSGVALGCQALLGEALRSDQVVQLVGAWGGPAIVQPTMLALRLRSLQTHLGNDPLAFALTQLGEDARLPHPWRMHHRAVRLAIPQPDLRPILQPLLAEAVGGLNGRPDTPAPAVNAVMAPREELGWHLIVEFGQSRSDLFPFALTLAQRHPGFKQILDENRKAVYRVLFKKNEMRQFWRLWDYVQTWANTHVYLNGAEVEAWKVYPYSQFLR